jgi:DNA-binding response OmpR family regulator
VRGGCGRNGVDGQHLAIQHDYDVIVLDVMLPGLDGFAVLRSLRTVKQTPVIMLTARDSVEDRIKGLRDGADDYLIKPFSFLELLARLQALTRRGRAGSAAAAHRRPADRPDLAQGLPGRAAHRPHRQGIRAPGRDGGGRARSCPRPPLRNWSGT